MEEKSDATLKYKAVGGSHFFGLANYTIFEASGKCFIYVYNPTAACGKNFLSLLGTPVFTYCENMNWSSQEEPP